MLISFRNIQAGKIVLFVFGILAPFVIADEIRSNTCKIVFQDITTIKWHNDKKTAKFTDVMATVANDYCSKNYAKCSLKFWNTSRDFKNSQIKVSPGYPKQLDNDLQMNFYIILPNGTDIRNNSTSILPKEAVATILQTNENKISLHVGVKVKNDADSSTSKPKLDNRLNYIMIPISFGLLLFVMVLGFCLHLCHKRKLKEIQEAQRRQYSSPQKTGHSLPQSPFVANAIPGAIVKPQQRHNPSTVHQETQKAMYQPILVPSTSIPEVIVKPQPRIDRNAKEAKVHGSISEQNEDTMDKIQSPPVRKKKRSHKKRRHHEDNTHKHKEDQEEQESDQERQNSKHRRKKKKHHKRKQDSVIQKDENQDTDREDGINELDISSRLPAPRKLPPLQKPKADNDGHDKSKDL